MRTVPTRDYDDPGATVAVYLAALEDVMATFEATGTPDALPRLMRDLAQRGVDEGYVGQELTSLVEMLAGETRGQQCNGGGDTLMPGYAQTILVMSGYG